MNLTLTITRPLLSLPDLIISNNPFGADFWLPEEGLEEPEEEWVITYLPTHPDVHGKHKTGARLDHTSIPVTIYVQGSSALDLAANKATLKAALGQYSYDVTLDLDGAAQTYTADPCAPRWGTVDSGMLSARLARASVVIPIYPVVS